MGVTLVSAPLTVVDLWMTQNTASYELSCGKQRYERCQLKSNEYRYEINIIYCHVLLRYVYY